MDIKYGIQIPKQVDRYIFYIHMQSYSLVLNSECTLPTPKSFIASAVIEYHVLI